jgi:glutamate synthase (NADPH) large chain
VATQNEKLRKDHFIGLPDMVVNYFKLRRRGNARAGWPSWASEARGPDRPHRPARSVARRHAAQAAEARPAALAGRHRPGRRKPRFAQQERNPSFDKGELAEQMVADAICRRSRPSHAGEFAYEYRVRNVNRSIGARLSGEIAKAHGNQGLPDDCLTSG